MTNSTDFKKLKPNQDLYLIRYSHQDHPDYVEVKFKYYDESTKQIGEPIVEFGYTSNKGETTKKANLRKATFRLFLDIDEMAKALHDCFIKRKVPLSTNYIELISNSQENRPELWI